MDLFTKAKELGIQTEFFDGQGHRHVTDAAALKIIIDALPLRAPHRFLGEAVVIRSSQPASTELSQAATPKARPGTASSPGQRICRLAHTGCI
jgi:4-alpha-glucanotransferase